MLVLAFLKQGKKTYFMVAVKDHGNLYAQRGRNPSSSM